MLRRVLRHRSDGTQTTYYVPRPQQCIEYKDSEYWIATPVFTDCTYNGDLMYLFSDEYRAVINLECERLSGCHLLSNTRLYSVEAYRVRLGQNQASP